MRQESEQKGCPFKSIVAKLTGDAVAPARETPGPAGMLAFDTMPEPLAFLGDLFARYGDVVRYQTRFGSCYLFVQPAHVQAVLHDDTFRRASLVKMMLGEGLLASDGAWWRGQRRLMQKEFLPAALGRMTAAIAPEVATTCAQWEAAAESGKTIDITSAMTELTLRIIVQGLFTEALAPAQCTALCEAVTLTITDLGEISWTVFGAPVSFKPTTQAHFASGRGLVDRFCCDVIARRRAMCADQRPDDLLTLLLEAEAAHGALTDQQVRDEMVTMLIGGHETTALALSWGWKLLSENDAVENRLHAEVDGVIGDRAAHASDVSSLSYTRAVFQELMRLYPPVWYMARVATEAKVIDGHAIPKGACVLVSPFFTHRHKDYWSEPERFLPERFLETPADAMARYAYFPFAGGRHQCMGMHFAWIEGVLILAGLAQRFTVRPTPGAEVRPNPGITLRQTPSLTGTVHRRSVLVRPPSAAVNA